NFAEASGKVGIGTTTPEEKLTVSGNIIFGADGYGLFIDHNTNQRVGFVKQSGYLGEGRYLSGNNFVFRRVTSGTLLSPTASDTPLVLSGNGNVGIGTTSPADKLTVVGDVNVSGCYQLSDGTIIGGTCVSDYRFKKNIQNYSVDIDKFMRLNPLIYEWKDQNISGENESTAKGRYKGFIADEVQSIYPERVVEENGVKKVVYSWDWIFDMIKVVQEQKKEIDILKAELCSKDNTYSWCVK
ncbi:MAG: tail fiber domain-containing protein, partial [Candidatus Pacearchaeota archaeon]